MKNLLIFLACLLSFALVGCGPSPVQSPGTTHTSSAVNITGTEASVSAGQLATSNGTTVGSQFFASVGSGESILISQKLASRTVSVHVFDETGEAFQSAIVMSNFQGGSADQVTTDSAGNCRIQVFNGGELIVAAGGYEQVVFSTGEITAEEVTVKLKKGEAK